MMKTNPTKYGYFIFKQCAGVLNILKMSFILYENLILCKHHLFKVLLWLYCQSHICMNIQQWATLSQQSPDKSALQLWLPVTNAAIGHSSQWWLGLSRSTKLLNVWFSLAPNTIGDYSGTGFDMISFYHFHHFVPWPATDIPKKVFSVSEQ